MGGRDGQCAGRAVGPFTTDATKGFDIVEHTFGDRERCTTRFGQARQSTASTLEDLAAQFFFEFQDLSADTGLRGVQCHSRRREVEISAGDFAEIAQALEIHGSSCYLVSYDRF